MSRTAEPLLRGVVPSTYVRLLYDYLAQRGVDAARLLGEPAPAADRGLGRYPVVRWRQLLETAAAQLRDPLLGLRLGQTITPAHFGVMGYVLLACGTLGAALQRMAQYQRLLYDVNPMSYRIEGDQVLLEWGTDHGRPGPLADETAITALVQLARDITGRPGGPLAVCFVNPPPADPAPYRRYFGCAVEFGGRCTALRFPLAALQWRLRQPDPALLAVLERQVHALLAELPEGDDFEQTVRRCIARLLRDGEPALERVADELHLSPRTLHRRLAALGVNYRALREDTRHRLALDYLADPRLTLAEISWLLGYAEPSAFTRAFRRWSGEAPQRWRSRGGTA